MINSIVQSLPWKTDSRPAGLRSPLFYGTQQFINLSTEVYDYEYGI
jgi:hypothetical protein